MHIIGLRPSQLKERSQILQKLFKRLGENTLIEQPFFCDYGYNIEAGKNFYANHNLVILDATEVKIGDNVVIGGGSVVTKNIPSNVLAVGNPCKVIREI